MTPIAGQAGTDGQSWTDAILLALDRRGAIDAENRPWARAILELSWLTAEARNPGWHVIRERWEEIYRDTAAGDRIGSLGLFATWNVLNLGWFLAVREGRFREAANPLASLLSHPQVEQAHWNDRFILRSRLAHTLLKAGDEEEALAQLRRLVEEPVHKRGALREVEIALIGFLHEQDPAGMASEALADRVQEVVHPTKRRKVRRWVPRCKSHANLIQLLRSTVPAKERETAIAEACSRPPTGRG